MKNGNAKKALSTKLRNASVKTASKRLARQAAGKDVSVPAATVIPPLTAHNLKDVLWTTLNDIRDKNILPSSADAIAAQSREILRTVRTQMAIASQTKRALPDEIIEFSEKR